MNTINPPDPTLPKVPRINLKAIREALKANGMTLLDAEYTLDVRCDVCGGYDQVTGELQHRLSKRWWRCQKCHPDVGDADPTRIKRSKIVVVGAEPIS
jgi:hypothetical protein